MKFEENEEVEIEIGESPHSVKGKGIICDHQPESFRVRYYDSAKGRLADIWCSTEQMKKI